MTNDIFSLNIIKAFRKKFAEELDKFFIVGGIVRNSLLNIDLSDIDLCSKYTPSELLKICKKKNVKAIETGKDYGTITVILNHTPLEITTLRKDVETFGRKAKVIFGTSLEEDSERRDFTFNALYLDFNEKLYDFHNGLEDLKKRNIRFIGNPEQRIKEDYLRIFRLYRFASQLDSFTIDPHAIEASCQLFPKIAELSAERKKQEFSLLLAGNNFYKVIKLLAEQNLLQYIYDKSFYKKLIIDRIADLNSNFAKLIFFCRPQLSANETIEALSKNLIVTRKERKILNDLHANKNAIHNIADKQNLNYLLSCYPKETCLIFAEYAYSHAFINKEVLANLRNYIDEITPPKFPVSGTDLLAIGFVQNSELSNTLDRLRAIWAKNDFSTTKDELLDLLKAKSNTYLS